MPFDVVIRIHNVEKLEDLEYLIALLKQINLKHRTTLTTSTGEIVVSPGEKTNSKSC